MVGDVAWFRRGGDLIRQRLDDRGMHRLHRVEQMCEANALGLGNHAEEGAFEAPGSTLFDQFRAGVVVAVGQLVGYLAGGGLVGQL